MHVLLDSVATPDKAVRWRVALCQHTVFAASTETNKCMTRAKTRRPLARHPECQERRKPGKTKFPETGARIEGIGRRLSSEVEQVNAPFTCPCICGRFLRVHRAVIDDMAMPGAFCMPR